MQRGAPRLLRETTGTIFQIERYSTHDGPGIRTTVFLKGCPLHCQWCHNPESQSHDPELIFRDNRCIQCWDCISACKRDALSCPDQVLSLDRDKCNLCGDCARICDSQALELVGRVVTVSDVISEVEKDVPFYDESAGGVTFSGGEPLAQPNFLMQLLRCCKEREIHTAVDTSGLIGRDILEEISKYVDLFLYDLKLMDDNKHIAFTGASNRLVLRNLDCLSARHSNILVRVPIIPGINDDDRNITELGRYLATLPQPPPVKLLPYHRAGVHKYARFYKTYLLAETQPPTDERMTEIAKSLRDYKLHVTTGGG